MLVDLPLVEDWDCCCWVCCSVGGVVQVFTAANASKRLTELGIHTSIWEGD
jgi:hypothetical protein